MAGANWPRYIAANVCYPAGKSASRTAGVGPGSCPLRGLYFRTLTDPSGRKPPAHSVAYVAFPAAHD